MTVQRGEGNPNIWTDKPSAILVKLQILWILRRIVLINKSTNDEKLWIINYFSKQNYLCNRSSIPDLLTDNQDSVPHHIWMWRQKRF